MCVRHEGGCAIMGAKLVSYWSKLQGEKKLRQTRALTQACQHKVEREGDL